MKKIMFLLITSLLLFAYLLMIPSNVVETAKSLDSKVQYSTIVPAKPPSRPPKE